MSEFLSDTVFEYVKKQLEVLNIKNYTITISNDIERGRNIVAKILRAKIEGNCKNYRNHNFILKIAPEDKDYRELLYISALFEREIYVYSKILPMFNSIQENISDPLKVCAEFYGANAQNKFETLILQDMTTEGFVTYNSIEPLDYNHTLLIMKNYGKLHALSYILRDLYPEIFKELKENTSENYFTSTKIPELQKMFIINLNKALSALDPVSDNEEHDKFKNFINHMQRSVHQSLQAEHAGKYAVIGHGDCWINNFLFKYDSSNPKLPTDVCLLDWQFTRIGSPALDLSYFLFSSTDKVLRDSHYDHFIQEYHKSLSNFFIQLGGNPENCISYEILQDHLKQFSVYGLFISVQALYVCLNQPTEKCKSNPTEVLSFESNNMQIFSSRIRGVIVDFVKYGYNFY